MLMCKIDWGLTINALTLIAVGIGAWKGIKELQRAQKWKKAEFLGNEYKSFINNDYIQKAFSILDGFLLNIPFTNKDGEAAVICYTKDKLKKALTNIHANKQKNRTYEPDAESTNIRLYIDKFLFRLGAFQAHIESELIDKDSLKPYILYWLNLMTDMEDDTIDIQTKQVIFKYIIDNKLYSLIKLFRNYELPIPGSENIQV